MKVKVADPGVQQVRVVDSHKQRPAPRAVDNRADCRRQ
jgi:hypothetical protein